MAGQLASPVDTSAGELEQPTELLEDAALTGIVNDQAGAALVAHPGLRCMVLCSPCMDLCSQNRNWATSKWWPGWRLPGSRPRHHWEPKRH